jgi:dihydroorotase
MQALDQLEAFASLNGPRFYGLTPNADSITLERREWTLPASYPYASGQTIVPLLAGETLAWAMKK